MSDYDTRTYQEKTIERLDTTEPKTTSKFLTMCWYILQKQAKNLQFIPNEKLTEQGRQNSNAELHSLQQAMDYLSDKIKNLKELGK